MNSFRAIVFYHMGATFLYHESSSQDSQRKQLYRLRNA